MPVISSTSQSVPASGVVEFEFSEFPIFKSLAIEVLDPVVSSPRRLGYLSAFSFEAVGGGRIIKLERGLGSVWVGGARFDGPEQRYINGLRFVRSSRLKEPMIVVFHGFY